MKILYILPELQIGGVERHVIDLANELTARGHETMVVSAGGRMEAQLDKGVRILHLPVHKKNPFMGYYCARQIVRIVREQKFEIIHAHSRVPAWIAMWASRMSGVPYVVTAHVDFGTKTRWIYKPYRDSATTICVSEAVRQAMKDCFYTNTRVIVNGLKMPHERWNAELRNAGKLLFVGRLSSVKGLQDVLKTLPTDLPWTLDVVGDGPQLEQWKSLCKERGIAERVIFHGYCENVEHYMANSSCLLFPSYNEGMPLTLAQAVLVGMPILASAIEPVIELKGDTYGLIPPGDLDAWTYALEGYLSHKMECSFFSPDRVPTLERMVDQVCDVYVSSIAVA
jgi:glycosyltransferase involved in cell wall biosynthesis